jgi:hypothetical protein
MFQDRLFKILSDKKYMKVVEALKHKAQFCQVEVKKDVSVSGLVSVDDRYVIIPASAAEWYMNREVKNDKQK